MTVSGGGGDETSSSAAKRRRRPEPTPTQRALGLLTRREHSRVELARKLAVRGVGQSAAQEAIDKLGDAGWQSDARFAESLLRSRAASGYGPVYIRAELATHRLADATIAQAMAAFEGDWVAVARQQIRRRHADALAGDRAARQKAMGSLLRRGFSMEQAAAALGED